jgi:hypothetical protein
MYIDIYILTYVNTFTHDIHIYTHMARAINCRLARTAVREFLRGKCFV